MLAHIDLDAFYASVEELDNPGLKGLPVIVGGMSGRGVVAACSYAARAFGVRSAMPIFMAKKLCPNAVYLPVRMARYQELSRQVMAILDSFSPLVEQISIDEAFVDLRGTYHLWGGDAHSAGMYLKQKIKDRTGLNCSIGVAPLRFLAKIASERSKPNGLLIITDQDEFIASIQLKEVSGVGRSTHANLKELGITNLIDLKKLTPEFMEKRLGKHGLKLWRLAHGEDPREVTPEHEIKSVSHEITFNHDVEDLEVMRSYLLSLCQKVGRRLRNHRLCASTFTLKVKFPDFRQKTFSRTLPAPTDQTMEIYDSLQEMLIENWRLRLMGVGAGNFDKPQQSSLFHAQKLSYLYNAEDILYKRFGIKGITRASTLLLNPRKDK